MRESSSTRQYLPSHSTQSLPLHPIPLHFTSITLITTVLHPHTTSPHLQPHPYHIPTPHVPTFPLTHLCTSPLTLTSPTLKMTPLYLTHPHTRPYSPSKPTLPPQFHPLTPHFCIHPPFSQHPYTTPLPSHMHYTSPPSHMHHTSAPPTLTITTTLLHHPHPHTSAPHTFILTVCFQASCETSWSWWSRVFPFAACVRGRGRGEGWRERT